MILKDYVEGLQQFLKDNPEAAELYAYTASDDEGNDHSQVYFTPSFRYTDGEDFYSDEDELPEDVQKVVVVN